MTPRSLKPPRETDPTCGRITINATGYPIEAQDTFDVQYTYEIPSMFGLDSGGIVTVGAINVTDEDPPVVAKDMGFDQQSHDARGRLWYARYQISL